MTLAGPATRGAQRPRHARGRPRAARGRAGRRGRDGRQRVHRRRCPGAAAHRRRRDQQRDRGPDALGGRAAHPGLRHGRGRRRVRGRPRAPAVGPHGPHRRDARPAPASRHAARRRLRRGHRRRGPDEHRPTARGAGDDPGGLRRRASRTPSRASWAAAGRATCRARGSGRGSRSTPSGPQAACRCWPISAEALERVYLVERLAHWGLRGLEVYYAGPGRPFTPAQVKAMADFAEARRLVATGGSDYHGDEMPYPEATAGLSVPEAIEETVPDRPRRRARAGR